MKDEITVNIKVVGFVIIGMLIGVIALLGYQLYIKPVTTGDLSLSGNGCSGQISNTQSGSSQQLSGLNVLPTGVPKIYGNELKVSFDDISASDPQKTDNTISKMAFLDQQINLTGGDLNRYIKIASNISCEYCCGAPAIIFSDGQPACGCAHSYAMRGLAKYLITKHGNEYTDDQILEEMGKWKTLFFPDQISAKAKVLNGKGIPLNYINLASNKYRGIEKGAAGGMVGGC